jgi:asparagine synthase (glutamine-hydrolysing)
MALFLSGGIDSGILAFEASEVAARRPTAISVVLGSRGTEDETGLVRAIARRNGLPLEVVSLEDWPEKLQDSIEAYDQPSVDGLNTFLIAGVARALGFKAALSGLGADEVFGGYPHLHRRVEWMKHLRGKSLPRYLGRMASTSASPSVRRLGMAIEAAGSRHSVQRAWRRVLPEMEIGRLVPGAIQAPEEDGEEDPLLFEQRTYLIDTLLRDADVMGMAAGVEIRVPFLDPDLLLTTRGIGSAALLERGKPHKWLLREAFAGVLDSNQLGRAKTGFTLDVARWLRGAARPMLEEARERLLRHGWFDYPALDALWRKQMGSLKSGHPVAWTPLMALLQVDQQFQRWGDPA